MIARSQPISWRGPGAALLAAVLVAAVAAPAAATTYTITTFADDAVVNGNCTLREALRAADRNAVVDGCPPGTFDDAIVLPSGTYDFRGQEALGDPYLSESPESLRVTSADLNPFHVTVDLHGAGRFLHLAGGGRFVIAGIGIVNGVAGGDFPYGGAIRAENVTLRVYNFRFVSNAAAIGGALSYDSGFCAPSCSLIVDHGTFQNNHVDNVLPFPSGHASGGAAYIGVRDGNQVDLRDVAFVGNSASESGNDTGTAVDGGALAMFAEDPGSIATCVRCNFQGNSVFDSRDASGASGGAALVQARAHAVVNLVDCRFEHNFARNTGRSGGEIAVLTAESLNEASVNLERLFIDDNSGPATNGDSTWDVEIDARSGGVISLVDSQLTFGGATGLRAFTDSGSLRLGHLTIADYPGSGAVFQITGTSEAVLQNSIITFSGSGDDLRVWGGGILAQSHDFFGGDPLFVDEPHGNYHLASASSAIDAGTMGVVTYRAADLDHHGRRAGVTTDIGCYEAHSFLFADDFEGGDLGAWLGFKP